MNEKQYRMLKLLDGQILQCTNCDLHINGRTKPYWTHESKYILIGEAPGYEEVKYCTPFVGTAGRQLWKIMGFHGFRREQFLILNAVNCRPMDDNKNSKPTRQEIGICKNWIHKYIKVLYPEIIIVMGTYAMDTITGESVGIMEKNATTARCDEYDTTILFSVHPMMAIYKGGKGKQMLYDSLKALKEMV